MQSTQLACPHCGSTLNFGIVIAEGTSVDCLICMRTFQAANPVTVYAKAPAPALVEATAPSAIPEAPATAELQDSVDPPTLSEFATRPDLPALPVESVTAAEFVAAPVLESAATIPSGKRASKGDILVSKPYAPPPVSALADKPMPAPPAPPPQVEKVRPSAAAARSESDETQIGSKIVLIAASFGLLILLTGGIAFAAWKITQSARYGRGGDTPIAKDGSDLNADKKIPVKNDDDDDEDLRSKIKDEVRNVLERKNTVKPGAGPDLDPIALTISKKPIAGLDQQKINAAIDKGVAYLKRTQQANGTWHNGHGVGHAAIGGLTLLECNVPADDPQIQKAAFFVRNNTANLTATYELSLAILFLDRLGDARDRPLIQGMALRLLAGQNECGGWTYTCPLLNPKDMFQLYAFLQSNKQPNFLNPLGGGNPKTQSGIVVNPKRDPGKLNDPFYQFSDLVLTQAIEAGNDPKKPGGNTNPKTDVITPVGVDPKMPKPAMKPIPPEALTPNLQKLPIVVNQGVKKGKTKLGRSGGDNSNTQFAMLALWAARRHNVPTDTALLASYQRFMNPQNGDGGWGYTPGAGTTHTMTNVGLLGLAMGHGAAPEIINLNPKNPRDVTIKPALEDPAIQKGLQALARYIGKPSDDPAKTNFPNQNLYFMWSVERVAMLYDLRTIGGKDWYGWGAQILVHNQQADGHWPTSHYHGATPTLNTCFALLFLRRSNLVQDLTNNLRLNSGIVDP